MSGFEIDALWELNLTEEEKVNQKAYEDSLELPTSLAEWETFLADFEELNKKRIPTPATDFNIPGIGECCMEILRVSWVPGEPNLSVEVNEQDKELYPNGYKASVRREDVSLAEWLGLWHILLDPYYC
ncbi:hypothetical protein [Anabaena azotica]|uniref:Uncharacterized protein n=1 Tax=Anabaena azotica FACHB-119 TaxID=947527 RepID=A0ABR8DC84_9NOST|nr:hypothetical protein [Anabaena azotica]MBD2504573.1 hypothetical protein [Anabaena azotica FACHB-119]